MKKTNPKDFDIDKLLKQSYKDDLPPEIKIRMKEPLSIFRNKMEQEEQKRRRERGKITWDLFGGKGLKWGQWTLRRGVPLLASIALIVLGTVLQSSGLNNTLSASISTVGTIASVSGEMARAESMECSVQMFPEEGDPLNYTILWQFPGQKRLDIKNSDKITTKILWFEEEEITIADPINNTLSKVKSTESLDDLKSLELEGYLSPLLLIEKLYGYWELKTDISDKNNTKDIYSILQQEKNTNMEITIEKATGLPIYLKEYHPGTKKTQPSENIHRILLFKWNLPLSSEIFVPGNVKTIKK